MVVYNAVTMSTPSYGDYQYPTWAVAVGFVIAFSSMIPVPLSIVYELVKADVSFINVFFVFALI